MQELQCLDLWKKMTKLFEKFNNKAKDEYGYSVPFARKDFFKEIEKYANNELTWPQFLAIYKRHYNIEDRIESEALQDMFFNELYCEEYDSVSRILLEHALKETGKN